MQVPTRIGDYELLEELARGGMGVVYRARQVSLNRQVAIKVLLGGALANPSFLERFRREAEAAASLNHPHIVSVYEVAEHEGQPYISMELIEGCSLAELVRDQPLPPRRAAQLLKTIAEAVQVAHDRGLLHRDLKPSNVLVDALDRPHIMDFGLAKWIATETPSRAWHDLTLTGQVLGTPNYMSPEQADPARGRTSVASDVYALGSILYQLLTGRPPFLAETITQTLRMVAENDPVLARQLNPHLPRDLETICARCLEKDPHARYGSARELSEELARYLNNEPILARPINVPARWMRWCRRKPALAGALLAGTVLLMVIAVGSPIAALRLNASRHQEATMRARAEAAERETEWQLYSALLEQARATVLSGELGQRTRAMDAIGRASVISNSVELRREMVAALALPDLRFERSLPYSDAYTVRSLDPAFERIALGRGRGPVQIRSLTDDALLATLLPSTNLPAHAGWWNPDGRYLAVKRDRSGGGWVTDWEIWETSGWRRVLLLVDVPRLAVSFHPRLPQLLAGHRNGDVSLWDLPSGQEMARLTGLPTAAQLEFAPDGARFAIANGKGDRWTLSVFNLAGGQLLSSNVFADILPFMQWHPVGRGLVAAGRSGDLHWMDAQTGRSHVVGRHKSEARWTKFSPDGAYLITGGWEREMTCWDAQTLRRAFGVAMNGYVGNFRGDSGALALDRRDSVQVYTFTHPSAHREFVGDLGTDVDHASFSPDGRWLAASGQRKMGLWDLMERGEGALEERGFEARCFFTLDGSELFASRNRQDGNNAGFRWRITPAARLGAAPVLEPLPLPLPSGFASLSVHSNWVSLTSSDRTQLLPLDQIEAGRDQGVGTHGGVNRMSADGRWLGILRHYSTSLYIYALPGLERIAKLTQLPELGYINFFAFSPSSDEVALYSSRGVEFWSTATWERTRVLTNYQRPYLYGPDGKTFWLTAKDSRSSGLYDARTLEPLLLLPSGMTPLAVSPDGRYLVVSRDAQRLQMWDLEEVRRQLHAFGLDWSEPGPAEALDISSGGRGPG